MKLARRLILICFMISLMACQAKERLDHQPYLFERAKTEIESIMGPLEIGKLGGGGKKLEICLMAYVGNVYDINDFDIYIMYNSKPDSLSGWDYLQYNANETVAKMWLSFSEENHGEIIGDDKDADFYYFFSKDEITQIIKEIIEDEKYKFYIREENFVIN